MNKLLDGPSYIVSYLFNINIVLADIGEGEVLMTESLMIGEELALLGCIPRSMGQVPRFLFPAFHLFLCLIQGLVDGWNNNAEALMKKR